MRRLVTRGSGRAGRSGIARILSAALSAWLAAAAVAGPAAADPQAEPATPGGQPNGEEGFDWSFLDVPPFPGIPITDAIRIELHTFIAPDASIGSGHVEVFEPELGLQGSWRATDRLGLRLIARVAETRYRFRGDVFGGSLELPTATFPDGDRLVGDRLYLHAGRVSGEGAYELSEDTHWFAERERWSALGAAFIGSSWEDGAFHSGLLAGGALGVGYEIPKRLRLALGISLRSPLHNADIDIDPLISLRWRPTDRLTLRTRELGLQLEYEFRPAFEVFVTGFRSSHSFPLRDSVPPLGDLSFRDRQVRLGVGFDWQLANWLRFDLEVGAIAYRRLRVREEDLGTILSRHSDPSAYFEVRFDVSL